MLRAVFQLFSMHAILLTLNPMTCSCHGKCIQQLYLREGPHGRSVSSHSGVGFHTLGLALFASIANAYRYPDMFVQGIMH